MEEKQNFPRATGFSGKILIALLCKHSLYGCAFLFPL